jgi:hypothetical protein
MAAPDFLAIGWCVVFASDKTQSQSIDWSEKIQLAE